MRIGRADSCEILVNDPEIALSHAEITHTPEGLFIRDLGSMNRLLINHHEVHQAHPKHGDVVEVGHTRFLIQAYVQAEVQGGGDQEDSEDQANRRKPWLVGGGLILVVACMFIFIPRCERLMITPRTPLAKPTSSPVFPPLVRTVIKKPVPVVPVSVVPTTIPAPVVVTPPPLKLEPVNVPPKPRAEPTPVKAEPVQTIEPVPVKEEPVPVKTEFAPIKVEPAVAHPQPKKNPTTDLIAAAQKELQEATLILMGTKSTGTTENVMNITSNDTPLPVTIIPTNPPTVQEPAVTPLGGLIKIMGTDINKFPETEQFREMRLLTIRLTASELQKEIDPDGVRVEVIFIDRDKRSGQIIPASSRGPSSALTVQEKWQSAEQKTIMASYVVPATLPPTERTVQYYGFRIRVFYFEKLQDELSQPKDLPKGIGSTATNEATPPAP